MPEVPGVFCQWKWLLQAEYVKHCYSFPWSKYDPKILAKNGRDGHEDFHGDPKELTTEQVPMHADSM